MLLDSIDKRKVINDRKKFIVYFFVSVIIFSISNKFLLTFYVLTLSILFYRSKDDYFWIAVFFTFSYGIGGFFGIDYTNLFFIGPIPIDTFTLFAITLFLKIQFKTYRYRINLFRIPLYIWLSYVFLLIFIGLIIGFEGGGKSGLRNYYLLARFLFHLPVLFVLPIIFNKSKSFILFANLVFVALIINLPGQFFFVIFRQTITAALGVSPQSVFVGVIGLVRPIFGIQNSFIALMFSLFFLTSGSFVFKKSYLTIILLLASISIFITATRGWIVAMLFFYVVSAFFIPRKKKVMLIYISFISVSLFFILYFTWSPFRNQIKLSAERFETVTDLAEGDVTLNGTNVRLTSRNDKVMNVFYKSPIVGNGFSAEVFDKMDQHVGNQNILMTGGIIGYMIFLYVFLFIIMKIIAIHKKSKKLRTYSKELPILIVFMFALFIIHSSSTSLFGYSIFVKNVELIFFSSLIISILNNILCEYQNRIKSENLT